MVVGAAFTLGYVVKNMEDRGAQRSMVEQLAKQRESLVADCNARLVQASDAANSRLAERDALLADQTARIQEQTTLIQTMSDRVGTIAKTAKARSAQLSNVVKVAKEAKTAATEAAAAAQKGVTAAERTRINNAVKGATK
jgi:flagellar biosynthesis/type III secretory pathway chaperone